MAYALTHTDTAPHGAHRPGLHGLWTAFARFGLNSARDRLLRETAAITDADLAAACLSRADLAARIRKTAQRI